MPVKDLKHYMVVTDHTKEKMANFGVLGKQVQTRFGVADQLDEKKKA